MTVLDALGLERTVELLAPISPAITYGIADQVWDHDVHRERFPHRLEVEDRTDVTEGLVAFNSDVWKQKKDAGMSLAEEIEGVEVPEELAPPGGARGDARARGWVAGSLA